MRLQLRKLTQALPKTFAKHVVSQHRMDLFRRALAHLLSHVNENQSEDYHKILVINFLQTAFRADPGQDRPHQDVLFEIDANGQIDVRIRQQSTDQTLADPVLSSAVLEVRRPYAAEMMTPLKNNVRALHKLILYYFDERERHPDQRINQLIITDVYNWFLIRETDFERFFYRNPRLKKLYQIKQQQQKDNLFFYAETARILRDLDEEIPVTYLNLREAANALHQNLAESNHLLLPIFNLLSPEHLLNLPITPADSVLDPHFYAELLYLIGLREITLNRKLVLQRRPEGDRHEGSLLEMTISALQNNNIPINDELTDLSGRYATDPVVRIGLSLCFIWLNRILFLKMLEGQLRHHTPATSEGSERPIQFLNTDQVQGFDDLNELFFDGLAPLPKQRSAQMTNRYGPLPYLNSSLFELTELERKTITVKALSNQIELPLFEKTIEGHLQDSSPPQPASLPTLNYLLTFLDAYRFLPDRRAEVQTDDRPLIRAASLGVLFEKLNGLATESALDFSPAYLTHDILRQAVVTRFNDHFSWSCNNPVELYDRLGEISLGEANAVINSMRIVDPAAGSGRFLVSALNELLMLKASLGLLTDRQGRSLGHYTICLIDDELVVSDENGALVDFDVPEPAFRTTAPASPHATTQRIREALLYEKKNLIENCLFGVDLNPDAVQHCQVRLWLELLKCVYIRLDDATFHTLPPFPNLDLNLKIGNALVGRFGMDFRFDSLQYPSVYGQFLPLFQRYRRDVLAYKRCFDKAEKDRIQARIRQFQLFIDQLVSTDLKALADIRQLEAKLTQSTLTFDWVNQQDHLRSLSDRLMAHKAVYAEKQRVFKQAIEWRFAFPEVLDEAGNFMGFDVVLGEPPRSRLPDGEAYRNYLKKAFPATYIGPADPYGPFLEQGLNLLKINGYAAYQLPGKWLTSAQGRKLRVWLKTKAPEQLITTSMPISFDKRATHSLIMAMRNTEASLTLRVLQIQPPGARPTESIEAQPNLIAELSIDALPDNGWLLFDEKSSI